MESISLHGERPKYAGGGSYFYMIAGVCNCDANLQDLAGT